jgi:hypothetical protein
MYISGPKHPVDQQVLTRQSVDQQLLPRNIQGIGWKHSAYQQLLTRYIDVIEY